MRRMVPWELATAQMTNRGLDAECREGWSHLSPKGEVKSDLGILGVYYSAGATAGRVRQRLPGAPGRCAQAGRSKRNLPNPVLEMIQ